MVIGAPISSMVAIVPSGSCACAELVASASKLVASASNLAAMDLCSDMRFILFEEILYQYEFDSRDPPKLSMSCNAEKAVGQVDSWMQLVKLDLSVALFSGQ
jgi:hypothetical protein